MTPNEELLINVTPRETRVAVIENGLLQELHIERSSRRGVLGNLYKGRVQRVMPGMQAAFVDIGLERAAFLHASDIVSPARPAFAGESVVPESRPQPLITSLVHEGQEIVVQVIKDPIGSKGARLTTEISIPSRYLVLLPDSQVIGISSRIDDDTERQRLKQLVQIHADATGFGYIVRTNAEGIDAAFIEQDIAYLSRAIAVLRQRAKSQKIGECIYEDLSLPMRAVRDLLQARTATVLIDSHETFDKVQRFAQQLMPGLSDRIQHYSGERPIFDIYGIEDEISRALDKQVPLKSGGYLVFDQTEAMTLADRIVCLDGGSIAQVGTPEELYLRPANVFVASFIGSPQINLLPATVTAGTLRLGDGQVIAPSKPIELEDGRPVLVGLRPEDLTDGSRVNSMSKPQPLQFDYLVPETLGSDTYLIGDISGTRVTARCAPVTRPQVGTTITLHADTSHLHLFDPATQRRI